MTKREIAVLACKILAIYVFLQAVFPLAYLFMNLGWTFHGGWEVDWRQILEFFLGTMLFVAVGALLWWQADRLAARMVSGMTEAEAPEVKVIETDIEPVAFSVVGLIILAAAVASAVGLIGSLLYIGWRSMLTSMTIYHDGLETVIRLAIGLWLLLGSRGMAKFVKRVRGLGKADSDDVPDETKD